MNAKLLAKLKNESFKNQSLIDDSDDSEITASSKRPKPTPRNRPLQNIFVCDYCQNNFISKSSILVHIRIKHQTGELIFMHLMKNTLPIALAVTFSNAVP